MNVIIHINQINTLLVSISGVKTVALLQEGPRQGSVDQLRPCQVPISALMHIDKHVG